VTYRFHVRAEREHLARVSYYEGERTGLGARYLADFESTIAKICEAPARLNCVRAPDIRRAFFLTFPCSIIYREVRGQVVVLAVAHHRQRPGYWLARL
jgi:toxin ParE1/3/4